MTDTLNYYNENSKAYFDSTVNADMSFSYAKFEKYLKKGAYILDAGCGSGRDSKYFLSKGYKVKAIDGSKELCKLASEYLEQEVECINFNDLNYEREFDAIWACASLLHVDKKDIKNVIHRIYKTIKNNGIICASFKYGDTDRIQGERYFNDLNEDSLKALFKEFEIKEIWYSDDVRPGRSDRWINVIARKKRRKIRVVAAITENNGKILIAKRLAGDFAGLWEFPGGKYETGEAGPEALKREIEEEFEAELEVKDLLCTVKHRYSDFNLVMDCFICRLISTEFHLHDHSSYRWIDPYEKGIQWVPADKKVIKAYKQHLDKTKENNGKSFSNQLF